MILETLAYDQYLKSVPVNGRCILSQQTQDNIIVYQAYNDQIADFAVQNQVLGGAYFSYTRMSWIKPNFLWMMYRCGWAAKENQNRVLAISISKKNFDIILEQSVFSSYQEVTHNAEKTQKLSIW